MSVLMMLKHCKTQSYPGNSTSLEGAGMGSHKTCHFANVSPKHLRSRSPCGINPWVPSVHREKGTTAFCRRALGCCRQRTAAFSRSGVVGSDRALQSPSCHLRRTRAGTSASCRAVTQAPCLSQHRCKDAVLQSVNMLEGLGREGSRSRGSWTL